MKKTFLYSGAGIAVLVVAFVALNLLASRTTARVDLTAGNLYTLSDATRNVLRQLTEPVRLRFYYTRSDEAVPIQVRTFARRVEDVLSEYKSVGGSKVVLERLNPEPDSDAEDQANLDGIESQQTQAGDRFYLGIAVSEGDRKTAIPALDGNREALLEYDLTRAITRVAEKEKPVIGMMSALPLAGNPMAMMMGQGMPQPQVMYAQLEQDYTVKSIPLDTEAIPPEVKLLLVIHPRGITDRGQYAIDQFVLRGGHLVAFVDPFAYFDQQGAMGGAMGGNSSTLEKLFKAWGIAMDTTKVVFDLELGAGSGNRAMPTVLALDGSAINHQDVITSAVPNLLVPMAGAFTGTPAAGLQETVLFKSSRSSTLVEALAATRQGRDALRGFDVPSGKEYPMAIKLTGRFKTAFPDGPPAAKPETKPETKPQAKGEAKPGQAKDGDKTPETAAKAEAPPPAPQLKEATADNTVVLVADSDLLNDGAAVTVQEIFGRRIVIPSNGNLAFFTAAVEQMAGDPALARLSARAVSTRPLTLVRQMEARAEQAYLGRLKSLEDSLNQTKDKLQALERTKQAVGANASVALTPEEQAEVDNFRKKAVETRRELKDVRKELRSHTEALEFWTKVVNIALLPLAVTIAGLGFAIGRRRRV